MAHDEPGEMTAAPKTPKSPRTPWPQKDKKMMGLVLVSPRNPQFGKLSIAEKGKVVTIETKKEGEDLQALITQIGAQNDEVGEFSQKNSTTKLPPYILPWKGKAKVPKDLEAMKSALQTPLLPNDIMFEGLPLGWVLTMNFRDWDLTDSEKFP